jgi:molybdenum cofactor guanylyltransferase
VSPAHPPVLPTGGYILAGGRSSRMGTDKALLQLAGKPLIQHAVTKLQRICADVHILSSNPALAKYAPLVQDLHPNCGPIGGIEAALAHSPHEWNLILPVDMPLLPAAFLQGWAASIVISPVGHRVAMITVDDRAQPALCLLHQETAPYIAAAIERGEFKLESVLEAAAGHLALTHNQPSYRFCKWPITSCIHISGSTGEGRLATTAAQDAAMHLWFANLNTPEDFAMAEAHVNALDT